MVRNSNPLFNAESFEKLRIASLDPVKALEEVLLRRGFLVRLSEDGTQVLLVKGSTNQDLETLRRLFSNQSYVVNDPVDTSNMATIIVRNHDERILFKIFALKPINGMTGTLESTAGWQSFTNQNFGHKVDVEHLDPGVALAVKTMPLARVRTYMSCDGHGHKWPRIWFAGRFNRLWWQAQLATIFVAHEAIQWFPNEEDDFPQGLILKPQGSEKFSHESLQELFSNLQVLCRILLYDEIVQSIGKAKAEVVRSLASLHDGPDNLVFDVMCTVIRETLTQTRLKSA